MQIQFTLRKNRKFLMTLVAGLFLLAILAFKVTPSYASIGVGLYPYQANCQYFDSMPLYSTVHFGTGPALGYLKMVRSNRCGTTWGHFTTVYPTTYVFIVSVWHPNGLSYKEVSSYYGGYQDTQMLDVTPGVENCIGAQVYVRNGPWIGWYFGGCWKP